MQLRMTHVVWAGAAVAALALVGPQAVAAAGVTKPAATPAHRVEHRDGWIVRATAALLHMSPQAVRKAWRHESLAALAKSRGMTATTLTTNLLTRFDAHVAALEKAGRLSSAAGARREAFMARRLPLLVAHKAPRLRRFADRWLVREAARLMHLSPRTVRQARRDGTSVAALAAEHQVTPATLISEMTAAAEHRLEMLASRHPRWATRLGRLESRLPSLIAHWVNAVPKAPDAPAGQ